MSTWVPGRALVQTPQPQPIREQGSSELRVTHINGPGPQKPSSRSGFITQRESDTPQTQLSKHPARHSPPGHYQVSIGNFQLIRVSEATERFGDFELMWMRPGIKIILIRSTQVKSYPIVSLVGYSNRSVASIQKRSLNIIFPIKDYLEIQ